MRVENLRQPTPADVTHKHRPFVGRHGLPFGFGSKQEFDGRKIVATLLFQGPDAELVCFGDAVIALVAEWLWLGDLRVEADWRVVVRYDSGRRKMYRVRTISHARSCACCGVRPC